MKIALCQLNPLVGDVKGNADRLCGVLEERRSSGCDLFVFPELYLQGYPPRDLLEKEWFVRQSMAALERLTAVSRSYPDSAILFGTILPSGKTYGKRLANAAVLLKNGETLLAQHKTLLPTYDIFDETRYFESAGPLKVAKINDETIGVSICEDAWNDTEIGPARRYEREPVAELAAAGATLLVNISASPFHSGKEHARYSTMQRHARRHRLPLVFVNQIGGNDDLIFDGNSMFFDAEGTLRGRLPAFREEITVIDTRLTDAPCAVPDHDRIESVHDALVLGVADYARKCGFSATLLGLSGGIDSALTAVIVRRAMGPANVWGVTMPSRYSSPGSVDDSRELAQRLGIRFSRIPIENVFSSLCVALDPFFAGMTPDVTEENLQARIRGTILMALSNKFNLLLLSTGNKSELAVGYGTLYGDMNGGLSVISDLSKEMVYQLAEYVNREGEVIPRPIIDKAPSAELRPNQKDEDSLPSYPMLDAVLERLIERGDSLSEIIADGFDRTTVTWIAQAISRNEYKRRQAPVGLKVTPKAFGPGRRFPIAARYDWL
ncbi:MAG: NAD+ synthase [Chitinispirillaceae bacterium]|nr:NAD+ synthase [Chitinispirillaceae bacterium]